MIPVCKRKKIDDQNIQDLMGSLAEWVKVLFIRKEVTWRMEHSRYFFFLANGAGAMNSYCRELLSPQTGIATLTLTAMKGFEAKKQ